MTRAPNRRIPFEYLTESEKKARLLDFKKEHNLLPEEQKPVVEALPVETPPIAENIPQPQSAPTAENTPQPQSILNTDPQIPSLDLSEINQQLANINARLSQQPTSTNTNIDELLAELRAGLNQLKDARFQQPQVTNNNFEELFARLNTVAFKSSTEASSTSSSCSSVAQVHIKNSALIPDLAFLGNRYKLMKISLSSNDQCLESSGLRDKLAENLKGLSSIMQELSEKERTNLRAEKRGSLLQSECSKLKTSNEAGEGFFAQNLVLVRKIFENSEYSDIVAACKSCPDYSGEGSEICGVIKEFVDSH